jgi:hypothetical protein
MTERAIEKGEKRAHFNENCFHVKTTFFDHKIKTLFTRFDFDHNGKIEKNDFAAIIKRHNQNKNVQLELSFVWEIISNFGIDMFNDLYNSSTNSTITIEHALAFFNKVFQKLNEFNALIKYVNLQLANVSVANSCTVHIIDYNFNSSNPFYYSLTYIQHGNNRNWTYYASEPRYLFKSQTFTNTTLKKMNL